MNATELKRWRKRLCWTQSVAARELDIRPPYYRELESGRRKIRAIYALACRALEQEQASLPRKPRRASTRH